MIARDVAYLSLMIPFGSFFFAMGMLFARWQIVSNPGQVGLTRKVQS
jgi:hypothetical protein